MSGHIDKAGAIWCERLDNLLKERKISQSDFAKQYSKKYGSKDGTTILKETFQSDVSKWLSVGSDYTKRNGELGKYGFPTFKTMLNIADFFGVSVSYLIGETDYETYNMERACKYTGLSPEAIKQIRKITKPHKVKSYVPPFFLIHRDPRKETLELLLTNPSFSNYLTSIRNLQIALKHEKTKSDTFQYVADRLPEEYKKEAFALYEYKRHDQPLEKDESELSETIKNLEEILELADDFTRENGYSAEMKVEVVKYTLMEEHSKMIQKIINSSRNISIEDSKESKE